MLSPAIDYVNCHLWPKNWGWFRAKLMEETLGPSEEKSMEYLRLHMKMARRLDTLPVGEPPSEPQGLNSIYDSDSSTLGILTRHAARLRKIVSPKAGR